MVPACDYGRRHGQHQGHQQVEQPVAGESTHSAEKPCKPMEARVFHDLKTLATYVQHAG